VPPGRKTKNHRKNTGVHCAPCTCHVIGWLMVGQGTLITPQYMRYSGTLITPYHVL
jgi:hypothetical protein